MPLAKSMVAVEISKKPLPQHIFFEKNEKTQGAQMEVDTIKGW